LNNIGVCAAHIDPLVRNETAMESLNAAHSVFLVPFLLYIFAFVFHRNSLDRITPAPLRLGRV
jgi:hypothetical protein